MPRSRIDDLTRAGIVALAAGRIAIGAAVWASPGRALRALGFDGSGGDKSATLARIAGTRDIALGCLQIASLRNRDRSRLLTALGAGVDAADAAAFALVLNGRGRGRAGAIGLTAGGAAAIGGALLARRLR